MTPSQAQPQADTLTEKLTVRVTQARNGFIVKTSHGMFVYPNIDAAMAGIKTHYELTGTPKVQGATK